MREIDPLPKSRRPLVVAHRGASADAPENTLPAFELAWKQGAGAIEGDFRLTADGEVVCIHDATTRRLWGGGLEVATSTLDELQELKMSYTAGKGQEGIRIPTLAEVLRTLPSGRSIFIEVKCGPEILPRMISFIEQSPVGPSQVVVIAYDPEVISTIKRKYPIISALWIVEIKAALWSAPRPAAAELLGKLRELQADGLSTNANPWINHEFIRAIREAGLAYNVWTVDSARKAARFISLGATSITTNCPGRVIKKLGL